jgi:very-short-patch-repair endonuclease
MDRKSVKRAQIKAITELAERQHGVIAALQLYSLGLSETQVRARAANGLLQRVHRGVYSLGRRSLTPNGHWMAAVLACGENAVLSHQTAGELWKIRRLTLGADRRRSIHVTVRGGRGARGRPGIIVHRRQTLLDEEVTTTEGIPVTTPARTVLDLAASLPRRQLERAIDGAVRLALCTEDDLERIVVAHVGRAGAGALGALLADHRAGSTATRNDFEERFLVLCGRYRLPRPEVNVPLLDYVVDFFWPNAKLVVEVDGRATHGTHRAFQEDRERDGRLAVAGYRALRFTWWDVTRRPAVVADRVRRLLADRNEAHFPGPQ